MPVNPEQLKNLFTRMISRLKEVEVELYAYKTTLEAAIAHHPDDNLEQTLQGFRENSLQRQKIYAYYDERLTNFLRSIDEAAKADNLERLLRDVEKGPPKGQPN